MILGVSCLCPTFGRCPQYQHLLEESIESFLRQDHPFKELLICNDCPSQTLECSIPGVTVLNMPRRCPSLGAKYNLMVRLARYDILAPWEDDDISLPHRLSFSLEKLGKASYFNPKSHFYWHEGKMSYDTNGYGHNASLFTRKAWQEVGGYPETSGNQDAIMDGKLRSLGRTVMGPLKSEEVFYIYRWGVSDLHLSGFSDMEEMYQKHGEKPFPSGTFSLRPRWVREYVNPSPLPSLP